MDQFKIYGLCRKKEIVKELERLGYQNNINPHFPDDKNWVGVRAYNTAFVRFEADDDERSGGEFTEITLQQLKDMPTPEKKVKREIWIDLHMDGTVCVRSEDGDADEIKSSAFYRNPRVETRHVEWEGEE